MFEYNKIFCRFGLAFLLFGLFLTGCSENSYGPPRKAKPVSSPEAAAEETSAAPISRPSEPVLVVGDVTMPMPVPTGFKRMPLDHPLARAKQAAAGSDEILLCLFERPTEGASSSSSSSDLSLEALLKRDILQVSTLDKWLNIEVSSLDFLKIKEPWQEDSVAFNQSTLKYFQEAARGRLADLPEFSYNMGMIDSSPLHISFLKVLKHTAPAGEVIYTCNTTSLVWRYGKILRISYTKSIDEFEQIQGVVADSVGYLQKMQAIDRNARLTSETP